LDVSQYPKKLNFKSSFLKEPKSSSNEEPNCLIRQPADETQKPPSSFQFLRISLSRNTMLAKLTNFSLIFEDQIGSDTCSALIVFLTLTHQELPEPGENGIKNFVFR